MSHELQSQKQQSQEQPWEKTVREIETRIPIAPPEPIVFTGSSSVTFWQTLARDFAGLPVFNAGFGGSTMSQAVLRAPRIVLPLQPSRIVLFSGENDLAQGESVDDVMLAFQSFLRVTAPTPVVAISVKPSPARTEMHEAFHEFNQKLQARCENDGRLLFVDVWTPMLDENGVPRAEFWTRDGIHLSRVGYKLWTEILLPVLS